MLPVCRAAMSTSASNIELTLADVGYAGANELGSLSLKDVKAICKRLHIPNSAKKVVVQAR